MRKILELLLKVITSLIIRKYNPLIIAITGSVGKTSAKDAIYDAFSGFKRMRKSSENLNTEIGAPLVFIGENDPGRNAKGWLLVLLRGLFLVLKRDKDYPEIIVVEIAADRPGEIGYLAGFIRPDIAVITAIGKVPVHVEFYKSVEDVVAEKEKLISDLDSRKTAILNYDDRHITGMQTRAEKITFGFNKGADVLIKEFKNESLAGSDILIEYKEKEYPAFLPDCLGKTFAYISAMTFAVGVSLGIPEEKIVGILQNIRPTKGRLYVIEGKNKSTILDSSYNAAPESVMAMLDTMEMLPAEKKIVVLGDMLEIGKYSAKEHQKAGKKSASFCDYLICVGKWAGEVKKGALEEGMEEDRVFSFSENKETLPLLDRIITPGSLILIKGSQSMRTEKVVYYIMRHPEKAKRLLVRQTPKWQEK